MLDQRTFFQALDHTETVPQVSGTLAVTRGLKSKVKKGGTDQRISEQARARAGFHTSAWYPDDSPCLPTSSLKDQTCGLGCGHVLC